MKQAIILTAGEGRRLKPFTVNRPKAMLYVAGKPIIQYVLEALADNGIRDIVIVAGYHKEQLFDYIGDGKQFGVEVKFINQARQLGTAHALAQAKNAAANEFLVLAGDKLISSDTLSPILATAPPAVLVKREDNPSRYGVVTIQNGKLCQIIEKPVHPAGNIINTGIYTFNKDIFSSIGDNLDIPDVLNIQLNQGKAITAVETKQAWLDMVYPWDILSANSFVLRKITATHNGILENGVFLSGQVAIGKGTRIRANTYILGPVVIGSGCEIGPNVCIFPTSSIANNVIIAPFSEIRNSVIGDDVHIGSSSTVQDSVIDRGCVIGSHFSACSEEAEVTINSETYSITIGTVLGEGCHLGNGIVAQSGVNVGNYCQVKSMKMLSGKIPDKSLVI